jgi:hypothetical protein
MYIHTNVFIYHTYISSDDICSWERFYRFLFHNFIGNLPRSRPNSSNGIHFDGIIRDDIGINDSNFVFIAYVILAVFICFM